MKRKDEEDSGLGSILLVPSFFTFNCFRPLHHDFLGMTQANAQAGEQRNKGRGGRGDSTEHSAQAWEHLGGLG